MSSFIDNNGYLFNGQKPYVFYFDEGQSVNIYYSKTILYIADTPVITISISPDSIFKLVDMDVLSSSTPVDINNFEFLDINSPGVLADSLVLDDPEIIDGRNVFYFNIITKSEEAGEYIDEFIIDDGGNITRYNIGADFYSENEILRSNLANFGIEIPQSIQKAIYDENVHEDLMDNITMNRKWKELLLEYWTIFACKGNYNSLLSSLKWFEYGDLVKIQSYWKRNDNAKTIYREDEIGNNLDDVLRQQLEVLVKTSLIGLYCSRQHIVPGEYDDEGMPILNNVTFKHSIDDMMLKMTLLGNFYATYFSPIHLTTIHSTLENLVNTNSIKIASGSGVQRRDHVDFLGTFSCRTSGDFYIHPCKAYVYDNTIFGRNDYTVIDPVTGERHYEGELLGVDTEERLIEDDTNIDEFLSVVAHYTLNIGAIVDFNVKIDDFVLSTDIIETATISWKTSSGDTYNYSNRYVIYPENNEYDFHFQLLFQKADIYEIFITFTNTRGVQYSKKFVLNIRDDIRNVVDIFKVKRYDPKIFENINVFITEEDSYNIPIIESDNDISDLLNPRHINDFMFDNLQRTIDYYKQSLIFNYSNHNNLEEIGVNHTLMIPLFDNTDIHINTPAQQFTPDFVISSSTYLPNDLDVLVDDLEERFPQYWWFIKTNVNLLTGHYIDYEDLNSGDGTYNVLVGIRRYYSLENTNNVIFERTYKYKQDSYRVVITAGIIKNNITIYRNGVVQKSYFKNKSKHYDVELYDTLGNIIHVLHITPKPCVLGKEFQYGTPWDRVFIRRNYTRTRIIDEDRFYPILHYIEPLKENSISTKELCVAIPKFSISRNIDIRSWEFINVSNGRKYSSDHVQQPYITSKHLLTPGTYSIQVNYSMDETLQKYARNYAFIITKDNIYTEFPDPQFEYNNTPDVLS